MEDSNKSKNRKHITMSNYQEYEILSWEFGAQESQIKKKKNKKNKISRTTFKME